MKSKRYAKQKVFDQDMLCRTKVLASKDSWISYFIDVYSNCMGFGVKAEKTIEFAVQGCSEDTLSYADVYASKCCSMIIPKYYYNEKNIKNIETNDKMLKERKKYFADREAGAIPSAVIAAVAVDEARKLACPIDGDRKLEKPLFYSMFAENKFSGNLTEREYNTNFKAVIVGAGGIGTYAALLLAIEGFSISIYDFDIIEEHNLNRQFLYEGCVGKNKAKTIAEKLEEITGKKPDAYPYRFKELTEEADIILSCVDNWHSRNSIFCEADKHKIPVIDGGVRAFGGQLEVMAPNEAKSKVNDISEYVRSEHHPFGCSDITESNIVTNNGLIGALMAAEAVCLMNNLPVMKKFKYSSQNADKTKAVQIK